MFSPSPQPRPDTNLSPRISALHPWGFSLPSIGRPSLRRPKQDTPIAGIADPVSVPAADRSYTVVKKSGDCAWDDNTNTLSFTGITECVLTVTAAKAEYVSKSKDFSITPKGVFDFYQLDGLPLHGPRGYSHSKHCRPRLGSSGRRVIRL